MLLDIGNILFLNLVKFVELYLDELGLFRKSLQFS